MSLRDHVSCGRCNGSMEKVTIPIDDVEAVVKHVLFANHDLRKTYAMASSNIVSPFVVWKNVRNRIPRSSHSSPFEPLRRGREKRWGFEDGDVFAWDVL